MNIALPPEIENNITPAEASLHLALGLFAGDKVTLGQAAKIAGLSKPAFLHELGVRKIPVHYSDEELAQDIATVRTVARGES